MIALIQAIRKIRMTSIRRYVGALIVMILGCAQPTLYNDPTADSIPSVQLSESDLNKKIGFTRFETRSIFVDQRTTEAFQLDLTALLTEECARVRVLSPVDTQYPDFLFTPPRNANGRVDNIKLIQNGRRFGLQSMVTGAITSLNANEEDTGFLWFKDKYYYFRVQVSVSVYDTETGAKLIDQNELRDIEVDIFDIDLFRKKKRIDPLILEEAFEEIVQDISEDICDTLRDQSWKAFIVSLEGTRILVSAGETDGLMPGVILDVYHSGNVITGVDDQQFYLPGKIIGAIKILKVEENSAEAIQIFGGTLQIGDMVKLQD